MSRLRAVFLNPIATLSDTHLRVLFVLLTLFAGVWIALAGWNASRVEVLNSDECYWRVVNVGERRRMIVASMEPRGATHAAGIRVGDTVVAINGQKIETGDRSLVSTAQNILNTAPVAVPISYVVERDGGLLEFAVVLVPSDPGPMTYVSRGLVAFTVLWLAIGVLVVLVQPKGRVQRAFFLTSLTAAFAFTQPLLRQAEAAAGEPFTYALFFLQMMMSAAFVSFWIRFCSVFPVDQKLFESRNGRLVLTIPPAIMLVALLGYTLALASGMSTVALVISAVLAGIVLLVAVLFFLGGIGILYRGYRRLSSRNDQRAMRAILVGAGLTAFALISMPFMAIVPSLGYEVGAPAVVLIVLMLGLPVSFGYAIFRFQVMSFRLVVRTTIVYVAAMAMVVGIYLGVAYGISQALGAVLGSATEAVTIAAFVLCLLLFDPLKRELQSAIEDRFFPRHRDYSAHLADFARAVEQRANVEQVAALIASTLHVSLGLREAAVVLASPDGSAVVATEGEGPAIDSAELASADVALRSAQGIMAMEICCAGENGALAARFAYGAGLNAQARFVGFVLISRPKGAQYLSGRQIGFVSAVVTQGAAALEVARLYEEELARQRYQEQLAAARHIQQSLLTAALPRLNGLSVGVAARSALAVGGDYFRVQRIDESRALVVVADVSGKGLPASLHMAQLHGMVSIAGSRTDTPAEMLAAMNDQLYAELARGTFITATALMFDIDRGVVHYARAGHTPILMRTAQGLIQLTPRGVPLGFLPTERFLRHLEERSLRLSAGDLFVLYSDGVSEAMNAALEEFGDERLQSILERSAVTDPDQICSLLAESVENFRAGADQNDDVTLLVVRVDEVGESSVRAMAREDEKAELPVTNPEVGA